ncbi:hypothetical protein BpHYR1_009410 [Brachionus plicatilis]|uniref:Uncharacterized protein n=1 Tax=Brachionus plicatilis TaxID=10195 RepID=A0A3M7PMT3_BRAPC|nr:hypothetical protein BpHYR1_009410 [Brachionus plicatilis]
MAHNDSSTYSSDTENYLEAIKKTFVQERESKICKFVLPNQKVCNRQYSPNSSNSSLKYHLVNEHGSVFKECESNKKVKPDVDEKLVEWIIDLKDKKEILQKIKSKFNVTTDIWTSNPGDPYR